MCGIVGYAGAVREELASILLDALATLEYRGYDSAGIAIQTGGVAPALSVERATGGLEILRQKATTAGMSHGRVGLAHTRWATHGAPTEANAHPRTTSDGRFALVLNGVVENDLALRRTLATEGFGFATASDAETLLTLVVAHYSGDLAKAVAGALDQATGQLAFCVMHADHPDLLVAARRGSPLVVARGEGGHFVASDVAAIAEHARAARQMNDGEIAVLSASEAYDARTGVALTLAAVQPGALKAPGKNGFETFMAKEVHEQPRAFAEGIQRLRTNAHPRLPRDVDRVLLVGCGSAFNAASIARTWIEDWACIPAEAAIASELTMTRPLLTSKSLVIAISQSGETADTLACVRLAKGLGARTLALCNVETSTLAHETDGVRFLGCGPEIGVASTKAYTAMLLQLVALAAELATSAGEHAANAALRALSTLPELTTRALESCEAALPGIVGACAGRRAFLFIGRHLHYPTACEGALKLRELTYLNADGFAGGEMKHGSIALLDEGYPVVAIAPRGATSGKMIASIQEAKARGARIIGVITEGDDETASLCDHVLPIPATHEALTPLLATLPIQLLAYAVGRSLGRDLDRPRNLAKSVTVE